MKRQILTATAAIGLILALCAGDLLAGGFGKGSHAGQHNGANMTGQRNYDVSMSAIRPTDSRRRDGTFLSTGTTANGTMKRPAQGQGVQDGTHLSSVTPEPPAAQ